MGLTPSLVPGFVPKVIIVQKVLISPYPQLQAHILEARERWLLKSVHQELFLSIINPPPALHVLMGTNVKIREHQSLQFVLLGITEQLLKAQSAPVVLKGHLALREE